MTVKPISLRLSKELADELAAVAQGDQRSVSEVVREAIAKHISERKGDEHFQERLRRKLEEDQVTVERLMA